MPISEGVRLQEFPLYVMLLSPTWFSNTVEPRYFEVPREMKKAWNSGVSK